MNGLYAKVEHGVLVRYPCSDTQLRLDNPQTSFPAAISDEIRAAFGVYPVAPTAPPTYDTLMETLTELTPVQVEGVWTQQWSVRPAGSEELAARQQALKAEITAQVQQRLDTFAQSRGYDNIVSACSYATSQHIKYGPEGRYCVAAREDTWDVMFQIEADVAAGLRPIPRSYEEIEPELPVLTWPT